MNHEVADNEGLHGRIESKLGALHLPGARQHYRELAGELQTTPEALAILEALLEAENRSREQNRYQRNLRAARFPVVKELSAFNFTAIPSLSKPKVDELAGSGNGCCSLRTAQVGV